MEKDPPAWLNKEFLSLALQGGEKSKANLEIVDYSLNLAVAPGNNYASHVFRVNVEYKVEGSPDPQSVSLIVKASIEKGVLAEFTENIDMFSIEASIYRNVLTVFSEKVNYEFGPKCFFFTEKNSLVLKDLKPEGYKVCDRFKQLDIKHCRTVVNCLAKFHAASVAQHHEDPSLIETFHECFYTDKGTMEEQLKAMIEGSLKLFIESLSKHGHQTMAHYVSGRLDNLWKSVVEFCAPRSNSLNVLNHGDCWTSNLLFKYNDFGDIEDVKFIDYQLVRYSSPVTDLLYFIWTSANEDVRDNHQESLYDMYLQTLNRTLEELNCVERLTHEEYQASLKSSFNWVLVVVSYILPFTVCDSDNVFDFEILNSGDIKSIETNGTYSAMYNSKQFQELLPGYVRQFEAIISSD